MELRIAPVMAPLSCGGSHTDITSEVEQDRLLYRLAYYDELTRLQPYQIAADLTPSSEKGWPFCLWT